MATRKKKPGSLGPQPHWLRMSLEQRERTKQYIKEGLQGYERSDGIKIPGARRLYKGLDASNGFDLRHVERWSAAKLATARNRIQSLNTLVSRPFSIVIPRSKKQRTAAQKFTGQDIPSQKEFIVQITDKRDKAVFRKGKVAVERQFEGGSKQIKQRYLWDDYVEEIPFTFRQMLSAVEKMLPDMPKNVYGQTAYYTIITQQYGPIGRAASKGKIKELLQDYHQRYDPGGTSAEGHSKFAEQIIGFQMIGTFAQYSAYEIEQRRRKQEAKQRRKLQFSKPLRCPVRNSQGKRCTKVLHHKGQHKFRK
jgi:hypothetical protein